MTVPLIALGLGLLIFFIGLSLISVSRKEEDAREALTIEEDVRRELSEAELSAPDIPSRAYLLGLLFGGEGLILSVLSATALLVNGFAIKIPWYISLPVAICYLAGALVFNALKMYRG